MKKSRKWTENVIREYLKNHPEVKSRGSFQKSSYSGYAAALRMGILDKLFGARLRERYIYTPQIVFDYVKEHPEIDSRKKLKESSEPMHSAAYRFKIMDELFGKSSRTRWTKENILKYLGEHQEITSRTEFSHASQSAYIAATKLGMMDDLFEKKRPGKSK